MISWDNFKRRTIKSPSYLVNLMIKLLQIKLASIYMYYEPPHEKTNNLHMQNQRRRSADQCLCFRYTDSTIPVLFFASVNVQAVLCRTFS